jgi:hypothetical protein
MLYQGDANNPQGYFENRRATILNLRCLDAFQMHPTSFGTLPEGWKDFPESESLRAELRHFITSEFEDLRARDHRWGIKQPVTSMVLPLYIDGFKEMGITPHYVLCVRNPLEILESERALEFGDSYRVMPSLGLRALGSWLRYTLGSLACLRGQRVTVVGYGDLLRDPAETLARVAARSSRWQFRSDTSTKIEIQEAANTIRPELRHHKIGEKDLLKYPKILSATYRLATNFDDQRESNWVEVADLWGQYLQWHEIFDEPGAPAGKVGFAWMESGKQRAVEVGFVPSNKWQTVKLVIPAPPKTRLNGFLYGWPAKIWIRKASWRLSSSKISEEIPAEIGCGLASQMVSQGGLLELSLVYEPSQISLQTPNRTGPYELELEFLLEYGPNITANLSARLSARLEQCVAEAEALLQSLAKAQR